MHGVGVAFTYAPPSPPFLRCISIANLWTTCVNSIFLGNGFPASERQFCSFEYSIGDFRGIPEFLSLLLPPFLDLIFSVIPPLNSTLGLPNWIYFSLFFITFFFFPHSLICVSKAVVEVEVVVLVVVVAAVVWRRWSWFTYAADSAAVGFLWINLGQLVGSLLFLLHLIFRLLLFYFTFIFSLLFCLISVLFSTWVFVGVAPNRKHRNWGWTESKVICKPNDCRALLENTSLRFSFVFKFLFVLEWGCTRIFYALFPNTISWLTGYYHALKFGGMWEDRFRLGSDLSNIWQTLEIKDEIEQFIGTISSLYFLSTLFIILNLVLKKRKRLI